MSLKTKLVASVVSFMMVLSLLMVGVFAAPSASVNLGGSISFTAKDVYATISGYRQNGTAAKTYINGAEAGITIDYTTESYTGNELAGDMAFAGAGETNAIVYYVKIKNKATDRKLGVKIEETTTITAGNVTIVRSGTDGLGFDKYGEQSGVSKTFNIDEDGEIFLRWTITLNDANISAALSFRPSITLTNEEQTTSDTYMTLVGAIITMNLDGTERQYRVLKSENGIAEAMGMFSVYTGHYDDSDSAYNGSLIDTALNETWYATLNDTAKAAIQETSITQYSYIHNSSVEYNENTYASFAVYRSKTAVSTMDRKVYALDIADIHDYFSGRFGTSDIYEFFGGQDATSFDNCWLRSALEGGGAWYARGDRGFLNMNNINDIDCAARPAFHIDLSKVTFTVA